MSRYKIYIIFLLIVGGGLAAAYFIYQGYYPIALVGNDFVSARKFYQEYRAASFYYENALKAYAPAQDIVKLKPEDIELSVLDKLIEDSLINVGAEKEVGADLGNLIGNKLQKFASDAELDKAAAAVYGLGRDDFWNEVLVPQATREVLAGRLFLEGQKIEDWILDARRSARVIVFSPQFRWDGEKVAGKQ